MSPDAHEALRAVLDRYLHAYKACDAAGCAAEFAHDAWVLSPWSSPAKGRAEIAAQHTDWFAEDERNKEMTFVDLQVSGDLANGLVRYAADIPGEHGPERVFGVGLNSFRRGRDGNWQITHSSLHEVADPSMLEAT